MSLNVLIVDDEPLARARMRKLLEPFASRAVVVGEAGDGRQAVEMIRALKPDVVFLDIQMPGMTGFEVLAELPEDETPWIVFATAFDEYAVKAFEENAIDYLLKPIEPERLQLTIDKLERLDKGAGNNFYEGLRRLVERTQGGSYMQRLQVKIGDRTLLVHVRDIIRFESDEKYTAVHTLESKYIIDTPLVDLEQKLDPQAFIRVHRAHLVAIAHIVEIQRQFGGKLRVLLDDKSHTAIAVSRNYVDKVKGL